MNLSEFLHEEWKKWFEFGVKAAVIWLGIVAIMLLFIAGAVVSTISTVFSVNLSALFAVMLGIGVVGFLVAVLINGVLWIPIGFIYELDWLHGFRKTPKWFQIGLIDLIAAYVLSFIGGVLSGGTTAIVALVLIIPLAIAALVAAVATTYLFDSLDWDMPMLEER